MTHFPNCNNATYIGTMYQSSNHQLLEGQILASTNCEYLLSAELNTLHLYSVIGQTHTTIPLTYLTTEPAILSLSDYGCLNWFDYNNSLINQFCYPTNPTTTTYYTSYAYFIPNTTIIESSTIITKVIQPITISDYMNNIIIQISLLITATIIGLVVCYCLFRRIVCANYLKKNVKNSLKNANQSANAPEIEMNEIRSNETPIIPTHKLSIASNSNGFSEKHRSTFWYHPHSKLTLSELQKIKIVQKNRVYIMGLHMKYCGKKIYYPIYGLDSLVRLLV
eukprot:293893_1